MELVVDVFEKGTNYWLVRTSSGKWYEDFSDNSFVAIDSSFLFYNQGTTYNNVEEIKEIINEQIAQISSDPKLRKNYTKDELDLKPQSITIQSNRIFDFVNQMNVGDFILIPSESSREFNVGIIKSEPCDINTHIRHRALLKSELNNEITSPNNMISRQVNWIKTIKRKDVPTKLLSSFLTNHKAVWNLDENKYYFQSLINPIFINENDQLNFIIKINKSDGVNVDQWSRLYNTLSQLEAELDIKFEEVKSNVQSPGWIGLIESAINSSPYLTVILFLYKYFDKNPIDLNKVIKRKFTKLGKLEEEVEIESCKNELKKLELERIKYNKEIAEELGTDINVVIKNDQPED